MRPLHLAREGIDLEIRFIGYQFPAIPGEQWDSNWLNVEVTVRVDDELFRRVDPCVMAGELADMLRWIARTRADREAVEERGVPGEWPTETSMSFMEPCLAFEFRSGPPFTLRVLLGLEFASPWIETALRDRIARGDGVGIGEGDVAGIWIDFPASAGQLRTIEEALRAATGVFPRRA